MRSKSIIRLGTTLKYSPTKPINLYFNHHGGHERNREVEAPGGKDGCAAVIELVIAGS
jgi:hypothetical protein